MILGDRCSRNCAFCSVDHEKPSEVDPEEPLNIARMVKELDLRHTVITSVTRDDLPDGGSMHFARTIDAIREFSDSTIEVLTPDFLGVEKDRRTVSGACPEIFNHNVETVKELYSKVRPQADYNRSLDFLKGIKKDNRNVLSKSGIMVGLGETEDQLKGLMHDLSEAEIDIFTCGQYLRPSKNNIPVKEYMELEWFERLKETAKSFGIKYVYASPFTRSSYNAAEVMAHIRMDRQNA